MYEVRVFDSKGRLKKTIDREQVAKIIWDKNSLDPGNFRRKVRGKLNTRKCKECGQLFLAKGPRQIFCKKEGEAPGKRDECSRENTKKRLRVPVVIHICPGCNTSFEGNKNRKYCNNPCRDAKDPKKI